MIEIEHVSKNYGGHQAVTDLSFTIEDGHIYGFLGPNGAGKSTTMNIMTGCLSMTEGTVRICGHDIFEEPIDAKRCIGYLPEIPPLYIDMTPIEYLVFVARAKSVPKDQIESEVSSAIQRSGITDVANRLIKNLSKGYRQRVGIAQALIGSPEVIILDEPTVGLDPAQIIEIRDLIKNLGQQHTVILSSHILSEVQQVCDKIIIIDHGKLVANVDTADIGEDLETYFLTLTGEKQPEIPAALKSAVAGVETSEAAGAEPDSIEISNPVSGPVSIEIPDPVSGPVSEIGEEAANESNL